MEETGFDQALCSSFACVKLDHSPTGVTNKRFINHLYICPVSSTFVHDVQMPSEAAIKSGEFNKGALEWLGPKEALDKFETGEIVLYPPQYYLLKALVENNCEEKKVSEILGMRKFEPVVIESLPSSRGTQKARHGLGHGRTGVLSPLRRASLSRSSISEMCPSCSPHYIHFKYIYIYYALYSYTIQTLSSSPLIS